MKKTLLFSCLSLSIISKIFAQDAEIIEPSRNVDVQKIRFGAYFAPNLSWMKPAANKSNDGAYSVQSNGSKLGYTWGLLADYFFTENYGIATGFQLNSTGGKIEANRLNTSAAANTVYKADFNYSLQYFEIPFNLKLKTSPIGSKGLNLFGQIGVTAGVNIGKKATYTVQAADAGANIANYIGEKEKLSGTLTIAPFMLQMNVGGGVHYPISEKMAVYLGLFFNNGFVPDATNPNEYSLNYPGEFSDGNIRLNNFALRVGLFF